jgi:hypothetical protein
MDPYAASLPFDQTAMTAYAEIPPKPDRLALRVVCCPKIAAAQRNYWRRQE